MNNLHRLARALRDFDDRSAVVKHLRDEMRKPVPEVRRAIKRRAVDTLPHRGGLGVWVSQTKITASVVLRGRTAGVKLRGGRRSKGGVTDTRAIDRGRLRHPSWGRRTRGQWFTQSVPPGFFTKPAAEATGWPDAINAAALKALEEIGA